MFDSDYKVSGIYATYWKDLCKRQKRKGETDEEYKNDHFKIFNNYMDCYMAATILGIKSGRTGKLVDKENKDDAGMMADIMNKRSDKLKYIYQLCMLFENERNLTEEERMENAFQLSEYNENGEINQEIAQKISENLKIMELYFFGGLEILHEEFVEKCITDDDYLDRIYSFSKEYKDEFDFDDTDPDIDAYL